MITDFEENPYCISIVDTAGGHEKRDGRIAAKILATSLLRNLPLGDIHVVRAQAEQPLFRVGREGLFEEWLEEGGGEKTAPWMGQPFIDGSAYSWVFFMGEGSIALREIDHLLDVDADVLWAPMQGVPLRTERCWGYVTDAEMEEEYRAELPWSRPWREAASAGIWAVRGEHYDTVIQNWKEIAATSPARHCGNRIESAWNRLLVDTPLKVKRFEKGEIAFPTLQGADYADYSESAILHTGDWQRKLSSKFLQAQFFGTYFGDESGLFLDLMEP